MDSRTVWMVVETKQKQDELASKYPNSIILCDRSHIQDTDKEKALHKTTLLHEVCSVATAVPMASPLREWPVKVSNLMCNCSHCVVNSINDTCIYSPWRKARMDSMIEKGAEEAGKKQTSPFDKLIVDELKTMLREANLPVSGTKGVLIERLTNANIALPLADETPLSN